MRTDGAGSTPPPRVPRIDAHVHVGVWDLPDFCGRGASLDEVLVQLDRAGLDGAVVYPTDRADNQGLVEAVAAANRPHLYFFAWAVPGDPSCLDFLEREAGRVSGLKLHPSIYRHAVTDPAFEPFVDWAARHDKLVSAHCGRWQEVAGYSHMLDLAGRWPELTFILCHAGGDTAALALGAAREIRDRGLSNTYLDTASLREYWALEECIGLIGEERYLFGSDMPLGHPLIYLGAIEAMDLGPEAKRAVLGGNLLRLLRGREK